MSELPEMVWIEGAVVGREYVTEETSALSPHGPYIHEALAQAELKAAVAAEREACAMVANAAKTRNTVYEKARRDAAEAIRAHTHTDARAALDARDKRVREDALREAAEMLGNLHDGFTYRPRDMRRYVLQMIDRTAEGDV